jgi:hypothetical protein
MPLGVDRRVQRKPLHLYVHQRWIAARFRNTTLHVPFLNAPGSRTVHAVGFGGYFNTDILTFLLDVLEQLFAGVPRHDNIDDTVPEALQRQHKGAHVCDRRNRLTVVDQRVDAVRTGRNSRLSKSLQNSARRIWSTTRRRFYTHNFDAEQRLPNCGFVADSVRA